MKRVMTISLTVLLVAACKEDRKSPVPAENQSGLNKPAETEVTLKEMEGMKRIDCWFKDPDSSLNSFSIGDKQSTINMLGAGTKLEGDSTHRFYSADKKQMAEFTVHAGGSVNEVGILSVSYSDNTNLPLRILSDIKFKTGKGIELGISKDEIINKIGDCYVPVDSTAGSMVLYYRIDLPNDSKTRFLSRHNMPVYYASYRLRNDKLVRFEFGFEYP